MPWLKASRLLNTWLLFGSFLRDFGATPARGLSKNRMTIPLKEL